MDLHPELDLDPDPDPLVRGADVVRTKMSLIHPPTLFEPRNHQFRRFSFILARIYLLFVSFQTKIVAGDDQGERL